MLTNSTCIAWLTNRTRPTLTRCARLSGGPSARLALERAGLARHTHEQEGAAERDEEADRADVGEGAQRPEDLPHLLARERQQGEDREQRHRLREQPERGAQLAREPANTQRRIASSP